jgi:endonuclease III
MVPQLRAARLKHIAKRMRAEFAGGLLAALRRAPAPAARRLLKSFPGIGDPGADRILLFAEIAPVAAVPSSCPHVLVRLESAREPERYSATYAQAQRRLAAALPGNPGALRRAYLLVQRHGRSLCKRSRPLCAGCPLATRCAYVAGASAGTRAGHVKTGRSKRVKLMT